MRFTPPVRTLLGFWACLGMDALVIGCTHNWTLSWFRHGCFGYRIHSRVDAGAQPSSTPPNPSEASEIPQPYKRSEPTSVGTWVSNNLTSWSSMVICYVRCVVLLQVLDLGKPSCGRRKSGPTYLTIITISGTPVRDPEPCILNP